MGTDDGEAGGLDQIDRCASNVSRGGADIEHVHAGGQDGILREAPGHRVMELNLEQQTLRFGHGAPHDMGGILTDGVVDHEIIVSTKMFW